MFNGGFEFDFETAVFFLENWTAEGMMAALLFLCHAVSSRHGNRKFKQQALLADGHQSICNGLSLKK